jgi:hypothetical protein
MTTIVLKRSVPSVEQPVQAALESEGAQVARLMRQREIITAYRAGLPRPVGPEPKLVPGHAGPPGAEEAWIARLKRQRGIIKAYYQKRSAAAEAVRLPVGAWQELAKAA